MTPSRNAGADRRGASSAAFGRWAPACRGKRRQYEAGNRVEAKLGQPFVAAAAGWHPGALRERLSHGDGGNAKLQRMPQAAVERVGSAGAPAWVRTGPPNPSPVAPPEAHAAGLAARAPARVLDSFLL